MQLSRSSIAALGLSAGLHTAVISVILGYQTDSDPRVTDPLAALQVIMVPLSEIQTGGEAKVPTKLAPTLSETAPDPTPASMEAPLPPTAEEWQLASGYTLKNSKRYRNAWGQQVRSMMGTAVEGPDQGAVRFSIEIAPDGKISRVDTIWSTSAKAETLARAAISTMPALPPTPTGKPLIFEKTISFQPFDAGWPPIYKYDCLPDPPTFNNPWVWDGKSKKPSTQYAGEPSQPRQNKKPPECPDAPNDTVDAEAADMQRQFDMWESSKLNPGQRK